MKPLTLFNPQVKTYSPFDFFNDVWDDLPRMNENKNIGSCNVKETEDGFQMEVLLPGFKREEVNVEIDKGVLHIKSNHLDEKESSDKGYIRREFRKASFNRSFELPEDIDEESVKAKFEDGILNVDMQHLPELKRGKRKIELL